MSTPLQRTSKSRTLACLASLMLFASACGSDSSSNPRGPLAFPSPLPGDRAYTDVGGNPQSLNNAIVGLYEGTMWITQDRGTTWERHPYIFELTMQTLNSKVYPHISFYAQGRYGTFVIDEFLGVSFDNIGGYYSMVSSNFKWPEVTSFDIVVQFMFRFDTSQRFDPARSWLAIQDCGFSQGAVCSTKRQDVYFDRDLRKR